jgi:hypothetical protein
MRGSGTYSRRQTTQPHGTGRPAGTEADGTLGRTRASGNPTFTKLFTDDTWRTIDLLSEIARSPSGVLYPLAERVTFFPACGPDALLYRIHRDLLTHIGADPVDDAALLVIERTTSPHPLNDHRRLLPGGGS